MTTVTCYSDHKLPNDVNVPSGKLFNIQALRAIAAFLVVFQHIVDSWNNYTGKIYAAPVHLDIGAAGVDLFFVISGFIMVQTTALGTETPLRFFLKRVARVAPLYWLLTAIAAVGVVAGLKLFGRERFDVASMLGDLFFIPNLGSNGREVPPLVFVGWTLNLEMFFYLIFSFQLACKNTVLRKLLVPIVFGSIAMATLIWSNAFLRYYAQSIVWEFAFGMAIAAYFQRWAVTSIQIGWACIAVGAVLLAISTLPGDPVLNPWRGVVSGIPAAFVVYGALVLERHDRRLIGRRIQTLGDASYSIYLAHPFVLQFIGKLMIATGLNLTLLGVGAGYLTMLIATAVLGTALYRWIEAPLSRQARRWALRLAGPPLKSTA